LPRNAGNAVWRFAFVLEHFLADEALDLTAEQRQALEAALAEMEATAKGEPPTAK
jgi:hypothetical protein